MSCLLPRSILVSVANRVTLSAERSAMKKMLLILFGLVVAVAAIAALPQSPSAPASQTELKQQQEANDKHVWALANVRTAETTVVNQLKDPGSAIFTNVGVIEQKQYNFNVPGVVCGYVNAKNSFGGYVGPKGFVVVYGIATAIEDTTRGFSHLWNKQCSGKTSIMP
jgi:hypothetical protein